MTSPRTPAGDTGDRESISGQLDVGHDTPSPSVTDQLRGRRAASWRLLPLESGARDPWDDQLTGPVSERERDSWQAAWLHLYRLGLPAIIPPVVLGAGVAQRHHGDAA